MYQRLAHDGDVASVFCRVNATCPAQGADQGRLVCIAEETPIAFRYDGDFNARLWQPGGFHRPLGARRREWKTATGKANFIAPTSLATDIDVPPDQRDVMQLITLRSNGQLNTTIYNYDDRLRGIYGSRHVVLIHQNDIDRLGLREGELVAMSLPSS